MNEKSTKQLKWLCACGLVCCIGWFVVICLHTYFELFDTEITMHVPWEDAATHPLPVMIFAAHTILSLALITLATCFFVNILRASRQGVIFPKSNITLIYVAAAVAFFYMLIDVNIGIAFTTPGGATPSVAVTTDALVTPLALLVFGVMYRLGHQLAEDNALTI